MSEKEKEKDKRSSHGLTEEDEAASTKRYKVDMLRLFQAHRVGVVELSSERLKKDLGEILDDPPAASSSRRSPAPASTPSRTPSPTPMPTLSPVSRELSKSPLPRAMFSITQNPQDDAHVSDKDPTKVTQNQDIFDILGQGQPLPPWATTQPNFTFLLRIKGLDLGNSITALYNNTRTRLDLDYKKVAEIALLSGIVHINEGHFGLCKNDSDSLHNATMDLFYSEDKSDTDVERSKKAQDLWSGWVKMARRLAFAESQKAKREQRDPTPIDTSTIVSAILETYKDCAQKDILPVFFAAINIFRIFNDWESKFSETEWMTHIILPFLQEFMSIQHYVSFSCANSATTAGQTRKLTLNQPGQARQPDVIGKTEGSFELYYGELKTAHATQEDINTDRLRVATFTKDSLDHMESTLIHTPPILSFQAIGGSVTFYIGAKIQNVIVHSKLSTIVFPTKLNDLELKEEVFHSLFQVQSLVRLASERTRLRRPISRTFQVFPTLGTPQRQLAMEKKTDSLVLHHV
ncbi:MAG: hypothetical protein J3Q66DRAFT_171061 [Benniella sp.]|nr:MAG: hypothetical protein J3Q66DRAFT_171061 [Benniella sp.]